MPARLREKRRNDRKRDKINAQSRERYLKKEKYRDQAIEGVKRFNLTFRALRDLGLALVPPDNHVRRPKGRTEEEKRANERDRSKRKARRRRAAVVAARQLGLID